MEVFWLCGQCDSTNNYETTKVCSVCGGKIDPKSEEKCIYEVAEQLYAKAVTSKDLLAACELYLKIITYKDARQKHNECQFKAEKALLNEKAYEEASRHLKSAEEYCAGKNWTYAIREYTAANHAFQKATNYADAKERAQSCNREAELCRCKEIYFEAKAILVSAATIADYKKALELFGKISSFSDAKENYELCLRFVKELTARQDLETATKRYYEAIKTENHETRLQSLEQILRDYQAYLRAAEFSELFENCTKQANETKKYVDYNCAVNMMHTAATSTDFKKAAEFFSRLANFKDSDEKKKECTEKAELSAKEATYNAALKTYEQGKKINIFNWRKFL